MNSLAVVEIAASPQGRLPAAMLEELYRASEKGVIILVLNNTGFEAVDKVLDAAVASLPNSIPGVRYLDSTDEVAIRRACRSTPLVFWETSEFRRQATDIVGDEDKVLPVSRIGHALGSDAASVQHDEIAVARKEQLAAAWD